VAVLLAAALVAAAAAGCSSTGAGAAASTPVVERDFRISAPARVAAGEVDLSVRNAGPDDHELIVVRTDGGQLPLRADGVTIDEESLSAIEAGALEPGPSGSVRHLRMTLEPGRYELFCNMAGHYLGGMHVAMVVT
jgi:uncharacterized cupredoxin-like copper-binding protein